MSRGCLQPCSELVVAMQVDEDGVDAVVRLGRGDMRQTLNILQSVVMAHGSVTEEYAYLCTGNPTPATIEQIVQCLLSEKMAAAYKQVHEMQVRQKAQLLRYARAVCSPCADASEAYTHTYFGM